MSMRCSRCGGPRHVATECHTDLDARLPFETPPHNGVYQGKVAPRTIPMAVCGSDLAPDSDASQKAARGRDAQARLRAGRLMTQRSLDGRFIQTKRKHRRTRP